MATTSGFKEYQRLERIMTVEDLFNLGMSYVDTPLNEGYAKLLVNYDLKNQGTSLTPRGGLTLVEPDLANVVLNDGKAYSVHHVGTTLVLSIDGQDATVHKYVLLAPVVTHPVTGELCYVFQDLHCFIETPEGFLHSSINQAIYTNVRAKLSEAHGITLEPVPQCNRGIAVSIEANTYIPAYDVNDTNHRFIQLVLQFTSANTFSITLPTLVPKEVLASQVINTGYNLMKEDPYDFPNTQNATGGLVLGGIIPRDNTGAIKLTANVGEVLTYHLNYTYPAADASKFYRVQWEVKETSTGAEAQVLQQVRRSPKYQPGADVTLAYTVAYKQFTMVVKVYDAAIVDAHTYVSDEDDAKSLAPLQVITVSSYYTTAGTARNTANLTPRTYDLTTCADLCTWQQRTVLWGVKNATTTLFVSQPNLPEYVPYPNNVEVFPEDIIKCVPYLTYLLVFTKSRLYQLTLVNDGSNIYYTTKCIQERLIMTPEDASTIQIVKNMVYFKSGNYFYMVVPNTNAGVGELQLAPVSRPIEQLLDHFEESVKAIIDSVYNISFTFGLKEAASDTYSIQFVDYMNYLDGNVMRNVYKCRVTILKDDALFDTRYIDFALNYDTVFRAWTIYTYESTIHRLATYESTVTTGITFLMQKPVTGGAQHSTALQLVKFEPMATKDTAPLDDTEKERKFLNYQMIDTGYRAHFPAYKKRFRELQFSINNTGKDSLSYHTAFTVDDDVRKALFEYNVQQITDTTSPDYGLIYVERTLNEAQVIAGEAQLGTGDGWILDFSKFPDLTVAKVRFKVSGKGYLGKATILSKNEISYELLGINWVYRKMNGR